MITLNEFFFAVLCAISITFCYIGVLNVLSAFFPENPRNALRKVGSK